MKMSVCDCPPKASIAAAPGVARGRAENGRATPRSRERAVHRPAEPLHGEILERQSRPVKELERKEIVVDLNQRSGRGVAETRIGVRGHRREFWSSKALATNGVITRRGRLGIGEAAQARG